MDQGRELRGAGLRCAVNVLGEHGPGDAPEIAFVTCNFPCSPRHDYCMRSRCREGTLWWSAFGKGKGDLSETVASGLFLTKASVLVLGTEARN